MFFSMMKSILIQNWQVNLTCQFFYRFCSFTRFL